MKLKDIVKSNRSFRRFHEDIPVEPKILRQLIDLARLSASGANFQPLKYIISFEKSKNASIFPSLRWAGYLKDWDGPPEGERPSAYIVILGDKDVSETFGCDHGIAAQSILLGAAEQGLGGCMIGSIQRKGLSEILKISDQFEILLVLAIGKPLETIEIEAVGPDGDIKYWRDDSGIHHVPKRSLEDIILTGE
jgi:nitroreductase